jgi:DNA invertase Pin-like site-specific DNA recombinase
MTRRIGYARVSTGDQHPEAQADRLHAAGCEVVYTDKGVSGTQARRPEWDKLLATLQPGDALVCTNLDRIGRSVANLVEVTSVLQDRDADLVVLDQAIDTTTPGGRLVFHILAAIAEFERELIIARTRDGQASVRRAGNLRRSLGGVPPLGFREGDEGADDWQLDPAQAAWLAEAAARVLGGEPVEAVHAALPVMHDATGREVSVKMLRAALQRPASAGLIALDGGYLSAATGGPLDEQTWKRLCVLFGSRRRGRPEAGRYPLGPLLRCGKCGNQLTGEQVKPRNGGEPVGYYACANPHKNLGVTRPCKGVSVRADDVHDLVAAAFRAWTATPAVQAAMTLVAPATAGRRAELATLIAEVQDQLADLETKRLRRHISPARYAQLEAEAVAQIDAMTAELDALDQIDAEPGVPFGIEWDELTAAEKRAAVTEACQTPIVVQPGNGGARALSAADRIGLWPRVRGEA